MQRSTGVTYISRRSVKYNIIYHNITYSPSDNFQFSINFGILVFSVFFVFLFFSPFLFFSSHFLFIFFFPNFNSLPPELTRTSGTASPFLDTDSLEPEPDPRNITSCGSIPELELFTELPRGVSTGEYWSNPSSDPFVD